MKNARALLVPSANTGLPWERTQDSETELLNDLDVKQEHRDRFLTLDRKLGTLGYFLGQSLFSPDLFSVAAMSRDGRGYEMFSQVSLDFVDGFIASLEA
jgi:hypothetical protein